MSRAGTITGAGALRARKLVLAIAVDPPRLDLEAVRCRKEVHQAEAEVEPVRTRVSGLLLRFYSRYRIEIPPAAGLPGAASGTDALSRQIAAVSDAKVWPTNRTTPRDLHWIATAFNGIYPRRWRAWRRSDTCQRSLRCLNGMRPLRYSAFTGWTGLGVQRQSGLHGTGGEYVQIRRREKPPLPIENLAAALPVVVSEDVHSVRPSSQPWDVFILHPQGALALVLWA